MTRAASALKQRPGNFTERLGRVLEMARDEAVRLNHEYVGTEHILLGLIREGGGVGTTVLHNLNVSPQKVRREIEAIHVLDFLRFLKKTAVTPHVQMGHLASVPLRDLPYTSRARKVLDLAMAEAVKMRHNYVGTEHVLLGLIREENGIAAQVLAERGVTYASASGEVLRLLDASTPSSENGATGTVKPKASRSMH